jgi:hypothetical protein
MAEIFVEQRGHQYVALRDKVIVSTGTTQADTAHRAHRLYPGDVVFGVSFDTRRDLDARRQRRGERYRTTTVGSPDNWRRIF